MAAGETFLTILPTIIWVIVSVAGALGLWALIKGKLGELFDYLADKTKIEFLRSVDEILVGAAGESYDDLVRNDAGTGWTQQALADGKVTAAEWEELKRRAIALGKNLIDIRRLSGYVGNVDTYLETRVGHAAAESKIRGADVKRGASVTPDPTP